MSIPVSVFSPSVASNSRMYICFKARHPFTTTLSVNLKKNTFVCFTDLTYVSVWRTFPTFLLDEPYWHVSLTDLKPLSHLAAFPLRLQGVVNFPRAPWDSMETFFPEDGDVTAFSWRFHGDLTATMAFLRSYMAFIRCSSWRNCLRSHCVVTALMAFCLHSLLEPRVYYALGSSPVFVGRTGV